MTKEFTLKQRAISLFLAFIFIVYVGNVSLFVHTHKVGDVIVVHSHPSTSSSHSHSANSISALSHLGHFNSLPTIIAGEVQVFLQVLCVFEWSPMFKLQGDSILQPSLRGPPVL